jgi:hypothetical protein
MAEQNLNINHEIIDAIIEKPIPFSLNGNLFYIYQPSLGVSLLCSQLLQELVLNDSSKSINKQIEILLVCSQQRDLVLRIVSLYTFYRRSDVLREERIKERMNALNALDDAELATLVTTILQWESRQEEFAKHLQLDRERRTREKIAAAKKRKGNSLIFGGKSLYGTLIDAACERYGWDYGYVLWGVSLINLNMLLSDSVQSVFLTKEEAKEAHVSTDGVYLDARDPKNLHEIQRLINGG